MRPVEQRLAQLAAGRRQQALAQLEPQRVGLLLLDRRRARARASMPAPLAASATQAAAPRRAGRAAPRPGTYSDARVEQQRRQRQRGAEQRPLRRARVTGREAAHSAGTRSSASADDRGAVVAGGLGREQQAVGEHRRRQRLHVVGQRVVAALERGERLRGAEQHQPGARAGAQLDARVGAGGVEHGHDVAAQRLAAVHRGHRLLRGEHLAHAGDRLEVEHAVVRRVLGQHVLLVLARTGSRATRGP